MDARPLGFPGLRVTGMNLSLSEFLVCLTILTFLYFFIYRNPDLGYTMYDYLANAMLSIHEADHSASLSID